MTSRNLLERPLRRGPSDDVEVCEAPCSHLHDHEDVQDPKAGGHAEGEVAGQNPLGMIANKCHPMLRRRPGLQPSVRWHVTLELDGKASAEPVLPEIDVGG